MGKNTVSLQSVALQPGDNNDGFFSKQNPSEQPYVMPGLITGRIVYRNYSKNMDMPINGPNMRRLLDEVHCAISTARVIGPRHDMNIVKTCSYRNKEDRQTAIANTKLGHAVLQTAVKMYGEPYVKTADPLVLIVSSPIIQKLLRKAYPKQDLHFHLFRESTSEIQKFNNGRQPIPTGRLNNTWYRPDKSLPTNQGQTGSKTPADSNTNKRHSFSLNR